MFDLEVFAQGRLQNSSIAATTFPTPVKAATAGASALNAGLAEGGFFPGIILYSTYWFPSRRRGRMVAFFMTALAVTGVVGGLLSGWILHQLNGVANLKGWQMLFLVEGIPSILIGLCMPFILDDGIRSAGWLTEAEKETLERTLKNEEFHKTRLLLARSSSIRDYSYFVWSTFVVCSGGTARGFGFRS